MKPAQATRCRKNDGSTLANLPAGDTQCVSLKSPVRANRTPGSVMGAPGNRCPYLDISLLLWITGSFIDVLLLDVSAYLCPPNRRSPRGSYAEVMVAVTRCGVAGLFVRKIHALGRLKGDAHTHGGL